MLFEPFVRFNVFSSVRVTEWPPIGGVAAFSAYDMFSWYKNDVHKCHSRFFSPPLGLWSEKIFLIAPIPDHCIIVLFHS